MADYPSNNTNYVSEPTEESEWRDLPADGVDEDVQIDEYDLTSSPNDFNTLTIVSFIESGAVRVPGFQRNYVWDLRRASKLIESLILGLPVPQVFLYEEDRNTFLVIDGQQRLLTIYFFVKQRFPRRHKRGQLRNLLPGSGVVPDAVLFDDEYFESFNLRLPDVVPGQRNKFSRRNYSTLGEHKTAFDLRTIRNIIVKQIHPLGDDSSIYEMFHRLNTGGVNLTPQEIRASLYHSPFFDMLSAVNNHPKWRELLGLREPDTNLRDEEILLRAVAMRRLGDHYGSSMAQFLNSFSKQARAYSQLEIEQTREELEWFFGAVSDLGVGGKAFFSRNGKFSVTVFEAAFAAASKLHAAAPEAFTIAAPALLGLRDDMDMQSASQTQSNKKGNVERRLGRAYEILSNGRP